MSYQVEQALVEFLFRSPIIKEFFLKYNSDEWLNVLANTLIFGIQTIEATHKFVPVPELNYNTKQIQTTRKVESSIPKLKNKLSTLKQEISELEGKLNYQDYPEIESDIKTKPKMVDFWYQTDIKKKTKPESRPSPNTKPWVQDYSKLVKNQKTSLNYEDLDN